MQLRLPWVSRRLYEEARARSGAHVDHIGTLQATREDLQEDLRTERARYDDLLKKYHQLRVKGANPEPSKPAPIAPRPNLTAVDYAIENRVARANPLQRPALERHLRQYVASQKQLQGYDEDAVCSAITNGHEAAD